MKTNKGFTLVELLVVIAIIVTLASIVLVGIQSATKRAKDARIIADMSQIRSQIELTKDTGTYNGTYTFITTNDDTGISEINSELNTLYFDIRKQLGFPIEGATGYVAATHATSVWAIGLHGGSSNMDWCAKVPLISTTGEYYCVDSTGKAGKTSVATVCAGTVLDCGTVN